MKHSAPREARWVAVASRELFALSYVSLRTHGGSRRGGVREIGHLRPETHLLGGICLGGMPLPD